MRSLLMSTLLSAPAEEVATNMVEVPEGLWDRFVFGLQFSGIGIAVVFIVLILLMIVLKVFERIFAKGSTTAKAEAVIGSAAAPVASAPAPAAADDDMVIAAAIAAAVDAYYDNVQAQANIPVYARKKYQIRSFRRI